VELGSSPDRLRATRGRLATRLIDSPLFDSAEFVRYLEAAYVLVNERAQSGLPPDHLFVESA